MTIEWATLVGSWLATLAGALWAVWRWRGERIQDRRVEQNRLAALYMNPFLFACEELQSRLYNILCRGGLGPLRKRNQYPYAEETLYLVARYFAHEELLLRYTPYGTDPEILTLIQRAGGVQFGCQHRRSRSVLHLPAAAKGAGRLVLTSRQSEQGAEAETVSLLEFEDALKKRAKDLYLDEVILSLGAAKTAVDLPQSTRRRLARVQGHLVDLLKLLQQEVGKVTGATSFSLYRGEGGARERKKASQCADLQETQPPVAAVDQTLTPGSVRRERLA